MTWINAVLVLAVVVLGVAIWSIKRHKDPRLELKSEAPLEELIPSIAGMSLGMAIRGNAVETFLWKEGRLGERMADAFSRQARAGAKVRLVLDAVGCKNMGDRVKEQMR